MIRMEPPPARSDTSSSTDTRSVSWFHLPGQVICPDLLTSEMMGEADNWRGRVIRGFLRLMDLWPHAGPVAGPGSRRTRR
jgi:hypothetical protein